METVVLLPDVLWPERDALASELVGAGVPVALPADPEVDDPVRWVASVCRDLLVAPPAPPLLVVAHGWAGAQVPAVAFAQRAAHRAIHGYVLVDAEFPKPQAMGGSEWPDAPVTYVLHQSGAVAEDRSLQARLRGWEVRAAGADIDDDVEQSHALRALLQALV